MKKELIGYVGVDSGQVLLCDPCYIESQWQKSDDDTEFEDKVNEGKFSYKGCCNATLSSKGAGQLNYKLGHAGAGVCTSTESGDGTYPVYAKINEHGRITEITIKF